MMRFNPQSRLVVLVALSLAMFLSGKSTAQISGNRVHIELTRGNWYFTDEDSVENTPLVWDHRWFTNLVNLPDGGPTVRNPRVRWETALPLVRVSPDDPSIFSADPMTGVYTWDFTGVEVAEPAHLPLSAWDAEETVTEPPRFSASRSVEPRRLTQQVTDQTITVTVMIEEPPPAGANNLHVAIASPVIAYDTHRLVTGQFVSQTLVPGWHSSIDGVSASWNIHPRDFTVGDTYTFQAILRAVKSEDLLGSPLFVPGS